MAAGIGALQSAIGRMKNKLPNKNKKISVVYYNPFTEVIEWPPDEALNPNGVLMIPMTLSDTEWQKL